jgi:hypothetical protein
VALGILLVLRKPKDSAQAGSPDAVSAPAVSQTEPLPAPSTEPVTPVEQPASGSVSPLVVSHIKVTSDKVEDVSSLEAWKRSFIRPDMTDEQKALAIWETVVKFRHQDAPPLEFLDHEDQVYDPIKAFNVYGYAQCAGTAACIEALARYIGMEARGWAITNHSVPEVKINGLWSMFDASLINYFRKPDGAIAGVEEIDRDVEDWYARNPGYKNNADKLYRFMRDGGWKNGPRILAGSATFDHHGWQPAGTHGWDGAMVEYGEPKKHFLYDYSGSVGYEVNIQLRPGEVLTRRWSNQGLHVNVPPDGDAPYVIKLSPDDPREQLRYSRAHGDLAPGRIGNGTLAYSPTLSDPETLKLANTADNLVTGQESPRLRVQERGKPGVLVLRMPSSYVYLSGKLECRSIIAGGGRVDLQLSDNNGFGWKDIGSLTTSGSQSIDLKPYVFKRHDYRLKVTLHGQGTGLDALTLRHDVQHSQRPLPALAKGDNTITFHAGPQEGTVTVQGTTNPYRKGKNLYLLDFHSQVSRLAIEPAIRPTADGGSIALPIETPGKLQRLRIGASYRCRDARDVWTVDASFDGGHTFQQVGKLAGPYQGMNKYFIYDRVPPDGHAALVRLTGVERNTCCLFDLRIDADYQEPRGGFAPVKITYVWDEAGQTKTDVHIARSPSETYTIHCAEKPTMKSIALELATKKTAVSSTPPAAPRQTASSGKPALERPTLHSLGVHWIVPESASQTLEVATEYRKAGTGAWRSGPPLFRVAPGAHRNEQGRSSVDVGAGASLFAGSLVMLEPNTDYDIRLRLKSKNEVHAEHYSQAKTLAEPRAPPGGRQRHVSPGRGGGDGSSQNPFGGLAAADKAARPGDTFLLHSGVYEGQVYFHQSGEPGKPIVWRGAGDGEAILDSGASKDANGWPTGRIAEASNAHDIWFENLTFRNGLTALRAHQASRIVVRHCHIRECITGIWALTGANAPTSDFYISDNLMEGMMPWPATDHQWKTLPESRAVWIGGTGHVVCYNRIHHFKDGIDTDGSGPCYGIDFHNNDISEMFDDGCELDGSERNVRCFWNRITNTLTGISLQPVHGGPIYVFRNACYNFRTEALKLHNSPSGGVFVHNTFVHQGQAWDVQTTDPIRHCYGRNNLFIGTAGRAIDFTPRMEECDFDYDGFGGWSGPFFIKFNGKYTTPQEARNKAPIEHHVVEVDPATCFASGIQPPIDSRHVYEAAKIDLRLRPGSTAVGAGAKLPGFNDELGLDLGAYPAGRELPHYGPR